MNIDTKQEITVTERAINNALKIMRENEIPNECALRIGVQGGGCSGLTYKLEFDKDFAETDTVIDFPKLKIVIDGKSLFYLSGTELDYSDGLNGRGFIFNNPNASKTCGCGESFGV